MFVIVVNASPDPEDRWVIGPFDSEATAVKYLYEWGREGDLTAGYASVQPLRPPSEDDS